MKPLHLPIGRLLSLCACLALAGSTPSAQREYGGTPYAGPLLEASVPATLELAALNHAELLAEDEQRPKGAFRFGVQRPVGLGLASGGTWTELENGDRLWRLRVRSEGAYSLSPIFSRYVLPDGATLFVYDDERSTVRGAYTSLNNKLHGEFAIQPTAGEALTLEYYEPAAVRGTGELELATVVHDYRDLLGHDGGTDGGSCNVDVNCPAGAPWRNQINSVVRVQAGGFLCSAALINSTANDGRQLIMSANHCGNYSNAIFLFNFQRAGCNSGSAPTSQSVQGSTLLGTSSTGDFRLVEASETIPASYNPYYLGWNRTNSVPSNTFGIHHPSGCPKKISFDNQSPTRVGQYWRVNDWDTGTTEGGSSGSPLMDQNGRFIGQLCCGLAACGNNLSDDYGALPTYWPQVAAILDPLGTGATAIDGFDPNLACPSGQATVSMRNPGGINLPVFTQVSPAIVGTNWNTMVDTTGFPGAETVLVLGFVGPNPGDPLGPRFVGQLLCNTPFALSQPGTGTHAVPIPLDCTLVGIPGCAQVGIRSGAQIFLTNALDIVIGTF